MEKVQIFTAVLFDIILIGGKVIVSKFFLNIVFAGSR